MLAKVNGEFTNLDEGRFRPQPWHEVNGGRHRAAYSVTIANAPPPLFGAGIVHSTNRTTRMSKESRRMAGMLLVVLPTVIVGGVSILTLLVHDPAYAQNKLRQDLWRAGHAHAGVLLVLSLVALRYVDETNLSSGFKWFARSAIPTAAIFLPVLSSFRCSLPALRSPTPFINLA
jgi:uncharacterized membrane protein